MGIYSTLIRPGIVSSLASVKPTVLNAIEKTKIKIETPIKLNRLKKKLQKRKDSGMREQILSSMKQLQENSEESINRTETSAKAFSESIKSTLEQATADADIYQKEVAGHIANLALKEIELLVTYPPMIVSVFANPFTINTGPAILLSFKEAIDNAKQEANDLKRSFTLLQEKVRTIIGILESIPDAQSISDLIDNEFAELDKLEDEVRSEVDRTMNIVDSVGDFVDSREISSDVVNHFAGYVPFIEMTGAVEKTTEWVEKTIDPITEEADKIIDSFGGTIESVADMDKLFKPLDELRARKGEFTGMLNGLPDIKEVILGPLKTEIEAQEVAVNVATAFFVELDDVFKKTQKDASDKQAEQYDKEYRKFRKKTGKLDDDDEQRYENAVSWGRENGHPEWGTSKDPKCKERRYLSTDMTQNAPPDEDEDE